MKKHNQICPYSIPRAVMRLGRERKHQTRAATHLSRAVTYRTLIFSRNTLIKAESPSLFHQAPPAVKSY